MTQDEISGVIKARLKETGLSAASVSRRAIGQKDAIKRILKGHKPSAERLGLICRALGLEFYIGPHRGLSRSRSEHPASEIDGPDWLISGVQEPTGRPHNVTWLDLFGSVTDARNAELLARLADRWETATQAERDQLEGAITAILDLAGAKKVAELRAHSSPGANLSEGTEKFAREMKLEDGAALTHPFISAEQPDLPGSQSVPVFGLDIAAGAGALANEPAPVEGYLAFERAWLDRRGLDATQCVVVSVRGESMEPTLAAGSLILVDRDRRRRQEGHVYVVRSDPEDTLVVKRAGRDGCNWMLVSDNPDLEWSPVPWPESGTEVLGEVVWASGVPGVD